ncbi:MAG: IclR family transcriptional regulator [Lentisphaeria bacterium]|nr:IclR family transcriptional regulator [Lentisphaeria bacterium]
MSEIEPKPLIQVLERAINLLDLLAAESEPVRAADIAGKLGISQQCVGNLLRTLYHRGMVSQDADRRYRLGPHCFYLGFFADNWRALRESSRPLISELRNKSGNTVFLGAIENDKLFCLSLLRNNDKFFTFPPQFWTEQLHSTACGQMLMALLSVAERQKMLKRICRRRMTEMTITDPELLETRCAAIAEAGFAEIKEESVRGIWSLAVPVIAPNGRILASLSLSDKLDSYRDKSRDERLDMLYNYAAKIGRLALK